MTMITPSYLGETIEYSSLHACRSTLEDPTGKDLMEPGEAAPLSIVQKALGEQNITLGSGDIALFRTGKYGRKPEGPKDRIALANEFRHKGLAGLSIEAAAFVHDSEIATMICDGASDVQPSEVEGVRVPWHVLTLAMMGMMITDNADLEDVAATCARLGRWEFMLVMAPLRLAGGTSSPVNPIAIF